MIDFYITEQTIRFSSPVIAANSLSYLEAEFHFNGSDWDGFSKWAHFRQGETVLDLNLVNDKITPDMQLNLSLGQWEVYLTGNLGESRLTTVPVILTVRESGLIDEPLHQIPQTVAEQVDNKASLALQKAMELETAAENGEFDGKNFQILGYYDSFAEMTEAVTAPQRGDAYGIGEESPYDIYVYNGVNGLWVNNGSIQGPEGARGAQGTTFTPQIAANGNLSWLNNGGLENPGVVNIMGPQGPQGQTGSDGQSPYALAVEEGFTGTEATFNWSLANIASHAAQHGVGGTDPITPELIGSVAAIHAAQHATGGSDPISPEMIGAASMTCCNSILPAANWTGNVPYTQSVSIEGLIAGSDGIVDVDLSQVETGNEADILDGWAAVGRVYAAEANSLLAVCYRERPTVDIPVRLNIFGTANGLTRSFYGGSYSVTPSVGGETLFTEDTVMEENINVNGIPSALVSNSSGQTAIIG